MPNHQKKTITIKNSFVFNPKNGKLIFFKILKNPKTSIKKKIYIYQLDLVLNSEDGGDLSDFITNGEWYLLG